MDNFDAAEKKADAKALAELQGKLHTILKTSKADAAKIFPDLKGNDEIRGQLDTFKAEINKRVKK